MLESVNLEKRANMNKLEEKPKRIVEDNKYPGMYRLEWKTGDISVKYWDGEEMSDGIAISSFGMYNLSRATDILQHYRRYRKNMLASPPRSLTDALNELDS